MSKGTSIYTVRIGDELMEEILSEVEKIKASANMPEMSRSEVVRKALVDWVQYRRRSRRQEQLDLGQENWRSPEPGTRLEGS